jgi:hypothetical protein
MPQAFPHRSLPNAVVALALVALLTPTTGRGSAAELTRCNGFNDGAVAWTAVGDGSDRPIALRSLTPSVFLPDGSEFKTWEPAEPVESRRTFFVAQEHPSASDENAGTEDRPWKTIGRAASVLEPGDRVIVKQGVYREWVRPARGGSSPAQMITYQAAQGERVILSGADLLTKKWVASTVEKHVPAAGVWMIDLPAALFQGYNPFAEKTLFDGEQRKNPYFRAAWENQLYTLPRGLVFQNGRRLTQVVEYEELDKTDGAYWVEAGGRRIHVRPFGSADPNREAFEVTTRPFALAPEKAGLGFIRVDGFTVEHVANCVPVPQLGAISTMQGHHWIVENNIVRQVNGLGLDYGRRQTFIPYEVPADTPRLAGVGTIIRRNAFYECGAASLSGLGLIGGLVEDNYSTGCGWRRVEKLAESGGIKLHYLKHCLVRGNVVQGTVCAAGLWVDHSNHNSRITRNIVVGAEGSSMFLEASYTPNLIDQNVFWGGKGAGVWLLSTGQAMIANNLIGSCTKEPIQISLAQAGPKKDQGRIVDVETSRRASSDHVRVVGNIFYGFESRTPHIPPAMGNESDNNLFVNPPDRPMFDLAAWQQKTGFDMHSRAAAGCLDISPNDWTLRGTLPAFQSPRHPSLTHDFFKAQRAGQTTNAGPFMGLDRKPEMVLLVTPWFDVEHRQ